MSMIFSRALPSNGRTALLGVLLFLVAGMGLYMNVGAPVAVYEETVPTDAFNTLKGVVFLSLTNKGDNAPDLYELDVVTGDLKKTFADNDDIRITGKPSADGAKLAYMSALIDRTSPYAFASKEYFQLEVYDKTDGRSEKITDSTLLNKRLSDWSPDGSSIAFTSQNGTSTTFDDPGQWFVHIANVEGTVTTIDSGTFPFWSPDGARLLYMKDDGLYMYDFMNGDKKRVFKAPLGSTTVAMKLDVSDDGKMAVWTQLGKIYVLDIFSWEQGLVFLNRTIETGEHVMYAPVISPDNRYVLYKEADYNPSGEIVNPGLTVYDLRASARKVVMSFDAYDFGLTFISDWK